MVLRHLSISRVHGGFIVDKEMGVVVCDFGSKAGMKIDGNPIESLVPVPIKTG